MESSTLVGAMFAVLSLSAISASEQQSSPGLGREAQSLAITLQDGHTLTVKNARVMKRSNPGWNPPRYLASVDAIRILRWRPKSQASDPKQEERVISLLDIDAIEYAQSLRGTHDGACVIRMRDGQQILVGVPGRDFTPANYGRLTANAALATDLSHDFAWIPDDYEIEGTWADSAAEFYSDSGRLLGFPYTVSRPSSFTRVSRIVFNAAPEQRK